MALDLLVHAEIVIHMHIYERRHVSNFIRYIAGVAAGLASISTAAHFLSGFAEKSKYHKFIFKISLPKINFIF